jgi:hypothetical protein
MHDSRRYRDSAAECLLAAQGACELHCRRLHLSMADSWLSLARRDEAMDNLLASWDTAEPVKTDGWGFVPGPPTFFSGNRLKAGTETRKPCGVNPARRLHADDRGSGFAVA